MNNVLISFYGNPMVSFMAWMGFFYVLYALFRKALQIHYKEKPPTTIKTFKLPNLGTKYKILRFSECATKDKFFFLDRGELIEIFSFKVHFNRLIEIEFRRDLLEPQIGNCTVRIDEFDDTFQEMASWVLQKQ